MFSVIINWFRVQQWRQVVLILVGLALVYYISRGERPYDKFLRLAFICLGIGAAYFIFLFIYELGGY